jgi:hypothetical protein
MWEKVYKLGKFELSIFIKDRSVFYIQIKFQ